MAIQAGLHMRCNPDTIDWLEESAIAEVRAAVVGRSIFTDSGGEIELVQTHISSVFLTPKYVFKFKRPVDVGFADFSSLRSRRRYCNEELRLNRRLAPDVYLAVVPLFVARGHFSFQEGGRIIDYAVVMKRLPAEIALDTRLRQRTLQPVEMDNLADHLARFHRRLRPTASHAHFGDLDTWRRNWEENFGQVKPTLGVTLSAKTHHALREAVFQFMGKNQQLLEQRVKGGFIRNGHGDLRCEHIYLDEAIRIIDCVEFNERFRYGDVANDLAFLLMDLTALGHPELSRRLLNRYVQRTGDRQMLTLIPFYCCYRAFVRGKVLSMRLRDPNLSAGARRQLLERARRFFWLALSFSWQMAPPVLILMAGLMGSGKSRLAGELRARTDAEVLGSDPIRKELAAAASALPAADAPAKADFGQGIYTDDWNEKTYNALLDRARELLHRHRSVILDASFSRRADRQRAFALAHRSGAEPFLVECRIPDELAAARLAKREGAGNAISDGRRALLPAQKRVFEPIEEIGPGRHLIVHTERPLAQNVDQVLAHPLLHVPEPLFSIYAGISIP